MSYLAGKHYLLILNKFYYDTACSMIVELNIANIAGDKAFRIEKIHSKEINCIQIVQIYLGMIGCNLQNCCNTTKKIEC